MTHFLVSDAIILVRTHFILSQASDLALLVGYVAYENFNMEYLQLNADVAYTITIHEFIYFLHNYTVNY